MQESEFIEQVRAAASSKGARLALTKHAKERMLERNITIVQIRRVLKKANVEEAPHQTPSGDWKANFRSVDAGQDICVVVAIKQLDQGEPVFVVTVIDKAA